MHLTDAVLDTPFPPLFFPAITSGGDNPLENRMLLPRDAMPWGAAVDGQCGSEIAAEAPAASHKHENHDGDENVGKGREKHAWAVFPELNNDPGTWAGRCRFISILFLMRENLRRHA
ncbi:hypothetical protein CSUB01_04572 [Colletotrichum sublineola]|uniref:Uncharacterized protein n=1 Tax=Colletotrichum sublineola TaxID=1173701 RepID=A0A066X2T9_COLSU|nr:hypothetical protein CSUB01_04572 [Colletotrichum sublineola]